jgi:hypothetical protein
MRITLTDQDGERLVNGEVTDGHGVEDNWVTASIDAAWSYLRYTGADSITVRSKDKPASETGEYVRIATVALEIHDE